MNITKTFPAKAASVGQARALVSTYVANADACLLVSEAAQNAVRYGTGSHFTVTIILNSYEVRVTVTNDGTGKVNTNAAMPDLDAEGGRGIPLMAALATNYGVNSTGGRTSVWFAMAA